MLTESTSDGDRLRRNGLPREQPTILQAVTQVNQPEAVTRLACYPGGLACKILSGIENQRKRCQNVSIADISDGNVIRDGPGRTAGAGLVKFDAELRGEVDNGGELTCEGLR